MVASPTASVIIASAQSVAKVYVIGAVGFFAVKYPRKAPILPFKAITAVARFCFHALLLPLVYSTTASSVSPATMTDYWFVVVMAFAVLLLSYFAATLLQVCFRVHPRDYQALRISATFPNIVALPILIFPSLCEYSVVQNGYFQTPPSSPEEDPYLRCVRVSNTMIFCYFFSWSLAFWSFGYPQLMQAANQRDQDKKSSEDKRVQDAQAASHDQELGNTEQSAVSGISMHTEAMNDRSESAVALEGDGEASQHTEGDVHEEESTPQAMQVSEATNEANLLESVDAKKSRLLSFGTVLYHAVKQVLSSPPFWALIAGFITGCIGPLKNALFEQGGALRFVGSALETLGQASSPLSTMIVAASLVPQPEVVVEEDDHVSVTGSSRSLPEENPIMSDPTVGPSHFRRRSSLMRFQQSIQRSSRVLLGRSNPELRKQLCWFTLSRLILAPALVTALVVGLDCGGLLHNSVPDLAKLVIIVNSCVPGALVIVVVLKQKDSLADTAAVVAKVYLPTYLISVVTIAAWTAVGLWLTLPDDNGNSFCARRA